jgi:non-specific serine/threonine protein kinase
VAVLPRKLPRTLAGRYRIVKELSPGEMAAVYRGLDLKHDRAVAIKVLRFELTDRVGEQRFRNEIDDLADFAHPHIVPLIDSGITESLLYYVMPFYPEGSLADRLAVEPRLAVPDALRIFGEVAHALYYAHTRPRPIVHRDIKPQNIMLSGGRALLVDFGIARAMQTATSDDLTTSGSHPGTPLYMSPEQFGSGGEKLDARTDQYSLACVLYEMLAGQPPFRGDRVESIAYQHVTMEPRPLRTLRPDVPIAVEQALERALAKRPSARFATILDFAEAIAGEPAAGPLPPAAAPAPHTAQPVRIASVDVPANNLPRMHTSFIGREDDLWECGRCLNQSRLVTLTGPGGSGKTRLAVRLAERRLRDYQDGAWFADLSGVSDGTQLTQGVATAIGVREQPGQSVMLALTARFSGERALLILDNCEHIVAEAAQLAQRLLTDCPQLTILATSREALHLPGEAVYSVPPLTLPEAGAPDPAAFAEVESVRLFLDRARGATGGFELTERNASAVAEICVRLDGVPLAIELAAARVRMLSIEEIRDRLADRFRLLTDTGGIEITHRPTLSATCWWSYELLEPAERRLFAALAVFAGGWTLEAATAVCGGDEYAMLDTLTQLAAKSLIVVEKRSHGTRYRFLETLRAFARERLEESAEAETLRDCHLDYFEVLATRADEEFWGPNQALWLRRLEEDHANFLAAIERSETEPARVQQGLRIAACLYRFWNSRGLLNVGRETLERVLSRPGAETPTVARASALFCAAGIALFQGRFEDARRLYDEDLALARAIVNRKAEARALVGLGALEDRLGHLQTSVALHLDALALYREMGDAKALRVVFSNLGDLADKMEDYVTALQRFDEALQLTRVGGDQAITANTLAHIAKVQIRLGNPTKSRAALSECLEMVRELGSMRAAAYGIEVAVELALLEGEQEKAATWFAALQDLRVRTGLRDTWWPDLESRMQSLRSPLGGSRFEELRARGSRMSFETATKSIVEWLKCSTSTRGR